MYILTARQENFFLLHRSFSRGVEEKNCSSGSRYEYWGFRGCALKKNT
jgi:hypothetical protein